MTRRKKKKKEKRKKENETFRREVRSLSDTLVKNDFSKIDKTDVNIHYRLGFDSINRTLRDGMHNGLHLMPPKSGSNLVIENREPIIFRNISNTDISL